MQAVQKIVTWTESCTVFQQK